MELGWRRLGGLFGLEEGIGGEVDFVDFATVAEIEAEDLAGAKPDEFSFGQDGEELFLDAGQRGDIGLVAGEEAFMEGFEFGGTEGAEIVAELAVPIDEDAPGDLEVLGDAGKAVALGAEFEEVLFGLVVVHSVVIIRLVFESRGQAA